MVVNFSTFFNSFFCCRKRRKINDRKSCNNNRNPDNKKINDCFELLFPQLFYLYFHRIV
jgi:hypothetical protein